MQTAFGIPSWIIGIVLVAVCAVIFIGGMQRLASVTEKVVPIMAAIFLGLSILGYLLYAAMMGGKYCVIFTLDEKGILHEQQAKQAKKASIIGDLLVLAGAASGNLTTIGIGMTHGNRNAMYTAFKGTKKLTGIRRKNTIVLREGLSNNRVWCEDADFDFVWDYIKAHCERAEIINK
jgi:uncharacterized membrane protein YkvI